MKNKQSERVKKTLERLHKKLGGDNSFYVDALGSTNYGEMFSDIEEILTQELDKDRERIRRIIRGERIGESEGWEFFFGEREPCCPGDDLSDVYNKALETVINKIKNI